MSYSKPAFSGPLEPTIFRALSNVIQRVPILCAVPMDEDLPTAYYVRLPEIDLRQAVEFVDMEPEASDFDQQLQDCLNAQHNLNFENDGKCPFWRIVIFRSSVETSKFVASFVFHHSIGDGRSGMAFHRNFHAALLELDISAKIGDVQSIVLTSPEIILDPNMEEVLPLPFSAWFIGSMMWKMIFGDNDDKRWSADPIDFAVAARETNILLVSIAPGKVKALLSRSREHSVSLTATLEAILAESLFSNLSNKYTKLTSSVSVSMRRFIPEISDDSIGNFVSAHNHNFSRTDAASQESFWEEARRIKALIATELAKKGQDSPVGLLRYAGPLRKYFMEKEHKPRNSSFEVGNLGVFNYQQVPGPSDWVVGQAIFSQSQNVCGPPLSASIATGPDGSLNVSFAWLETTLERQWVERVIESFQVKIDETIRD
jgi:NRPS condensation-like uncharacterized protein